MELSGSNIKKIFIFLGMKAYTFRPRTSKFFPEKPALKKFFLCFLKKNPNFQETKTPKKSLYFRKRKP